MMLENTVTSSIDEYFELRKKAEMNAYLLGELAKIDERFIRFEDRLYRLESDMGVFKIGKTD